MTGAHFLLDHAGEPLTRVDSVDVPEHLIRAEMVAQRVPEAARELDVRRAFIEQMQWTKDVGVTSDTGKFRSFERAQSRADEVLVPANAAVEAASRPVRGINSLSYKLRYGFRPPRRRDLRRLRHSHEGVEVGDGLLGTLSVRAVAGFRIDPEPGVRDRSREAVLTLPRKQLILFSRPVALAVRRRVGGPG